LLVVFCVASVPKRKQSITGCLSLVQQFERAGSIQDQRIAVVEVLIKPVPINQSGLHRFVRLQFNLQQRNALWFDYCMLWDPAAVDGVR
jgi:hypothetical protein